LIILFLTISLVKILVESNDLNSLSQSEYNTPGENEQDLNELQGK